MSFLEQAKKPSSKAPIITIVGSPGSGKTSLGALFPKPIFIQAEDGSSVFESWEDDKKPTLMPNLPKSTANTSTKGALVEQLRELATADHDFKTVVIDSVTALNKMFEQEIAMRDGVGNVADASGGFHKGYIEVASWHSDIIYYCDILRSRKNISIIFLAHQAIEKIKLNPEESNEYAVFSLDMHKNSAALYIANSDAVLYLKLESFVSGAETNKKGQNIKAGRIMQTGVRKIISSGDGQTGYIHAKNRYDLDVEMIVEKNENPILTNIKYFNK